MLEATIRWSDKEAEVNPDDPGTEEPPVEPPVEDDDGDHGDIDLIKEDKYTILEEDTREYKGRTLHRIRSNKDFADVRVGQLGGWVEDQWNLSQEGRCWIYDEAVVMDNATVRHDAQVRNLAEICDNAWVAEEARVTDDAIVCDHAMVSGKALIQNYASVTGETFVAQQARVLNNALVGDTATVTEYAMVKDYATVLAGRIGGRAEIAGNAVITTDVTLGGWTLIDEGKQIVNGPDDTLSPRLMLSDILIDGEPCEKVDDTTWKVNVVADKMFTIEPRPVDPRSKFAILNSDWDISDDPRFTYPDVFLGMTDNIEIVVTNEWFPEQEGRFLLCVSIVAPPEMKEFTLDKLIITTSIGDMDARLIEADPSFYQALVIGDEPFTMQAIPTKEGSLVKYWFGGPDEEDRVDISDAPTMIMPFDMSQDFTIEIINPEYPSFSNDYRLCVLATDRDTVLAHMTPDEPSEPTPEEPDEPTPEEPEVPSE